MSTVEKHVLVDLAQSSNIRHSLSHCTGSLIVQGMRYVKQLPNPDLGARMHHAITSALDAGSEKASLVSASHLVARLQDICFRKSSLQAILVGSDIPDISTKLLSAAFAALDHAQVGIVPPAAWESPLLMFTIT